jgi:predicted nucleic acid-binding protein
VVGAANVPTWLEVQKPKSAVLLPRLDIGEAEAIALATELHADVLLIDEQAGREAAVRRGLKVAGALAVLDEADKAGLVKFDDATASATTIAARRGSSRHAGFGQIHAHRGSNSVRPFASIDPSAVDTP